MIGAIHFKTSMFDVSREKENPINPIYGISLLLWLKQELESSVKISEPEAEDRGWYSELQWQGNKYLIGASAFYEEGDDPRAEQEWVLQVGKYRSFREKLLGRNKMSETDSCFMFFKQLLEKHPQIKGVEVV